MLVLKEISQIKSKIKDFHKKDKKIALIPTMGALHEGHLSLIKKAKELADIIVVSIFVNKSQFNDLSDYKNYPRQDLSDLEKLRNCDVDLVFLPDEKEIFSEEVSFKISPIQLANCLCGASRAGHFDGVALIITKLFNIIKPNIAVFGEKDFQQLTIIKKLVLDFNFDIEIISCKTFREASGLAMSSRNQRLSDASKIKAAKIFEILQEIKSEVENAANQSKKLDQILQEKQKKLLENGFEKIDYLEIREEKNLNLVKDFNFKNSSRIFIAVYLDKIRLIDNIDIYQKTNLLT